LVLVKFLLLLELGCRVLFSSRTDVIQKKGMVEAINTIVNNTRHDALAEISNTFLLLWSIYQM
jgi:hypothetical protein